MVTYSTIPSLLHDEQSLCGEIWNDAFKYLKKKRVLVLQYVQRQVSIWMLKAVYQSL